MQPDGFTDWLCNVEQVFYLKVIPNVQRVKLPAIKLKKYASIWLENLKRPREHEDATNQDLG